MILKFMDFFNLPLVEPAAVDPEVEGDGWASIPCLKLSRAGVRFPNSPARLPNNKSFTF